MINKNKNTINLALSMIFIWFITPGLIKQAFLSIRCKHIGSSWYSLIDPAFKCEAEGYYMNTMLPISIGIVLIFAILLPILGLGLSYYNFKMGNFIQKRTKNSMNNQIIFSFFFYNYKEKFFYWDFVNQLKVNKTNITIKIYE